MTPTKLGALALALVLFIAAAVFLLRAPATDTPAVVPTQTISVATTTTAPSTDAPYTLATVATHNGRASCWTAINGKVYDVTAWIGEHPGGAAPILSLCGSDGSAAFNGQHGGQRRPANELAAFYLGDLAP